MERLLITGADTTVGSNLALKLAEQFEVFGLYERQPFESPGIRTAAMPQGDASGIENIVSDWRPTWLIHCGAHSASSWDNPPAAALSESEPRAARLLAELARRLGAQLTVVSSDAVFAGPRMFHEETSPPSGMTSQAERALAVERAVEGNGALIIRTHAYGWSATEDCQDFVERAYGWLAHGTAAAAEGLRHATPILATDLAELLSRAYELRLTGLYHLGGAERTSPFRFVGELAMACGLSPPTQAPAESMDEPAEQGETSLNSKRARRALQMAMPLLRDGLNRFSQQAADGWRDRLRSAGWAAGRHQMVA